MDGLFPNVAADRPKQSFDLTSFFKSVVFRQEEQWTPAEAFLCIITGAATADGVISPEENEEILVTLHRSRLFKSESGDKLREIGIRVADRLQRRGDHAVEDACALLPREFANSAFAHAVDIVMADGVYVRAEVDYLEKLVTWLGISHDDARKIVEVLDMKNCC